MKRHLITMMFALLVVGLLTACSNGDEQMTVITEPEVPQKEESSDADDAQRDSSQESEASKTEDSSGTPIVVVPKQREDITLTAEGSIINDAVNQFSLKFFKELYNHQTSPVNTMVSPFSAQVALSMAANGAKGQTLEEILTAMNLKDFSLDDVNQYNKTIVKALTELDNTSFVSSANGIWSKVQLLESYINQIRSVFNANVKTTDFSKEDINAINNWAKEQTHGMIPTLIDKDSDVDFLVVLANALYFEAVWEEPFVSDFTKKDKFTNSDKSQTDVDMMREAGYRNYLNCSSFDLCEKRYGNSAFSMVFLLPHDNIALEKSINDFCQMDWKELSAKLSENFKYVLLSVPKIQIENQKYDLIPSLKDLGIQTAFNGLADFSNMTESTGLFISAVEQKTALILNETGTTAAATTAIELSAISTGEEPVPLDFKLNRPFAFIIKEKSTGAILFAGAINKQ